MIQRVIRVRNQLGLHAREAARLVRLTSQFESEIRLCRIHSRDGIDAKSILGILSLAAPCGADLRVIACGIDEEAAIEAIMRLMDRDRIEEDDLER